MITQLEILSLFTLAIRIHVLKILKKITKYIGMSLSLIPYVLCFKCLRWNSNDSWDE